MVWTAIEMVFVLVWGVACRTFMWVDGVVPVNSFPHRKNGIEKFGESCGMGLEGAVYLAVSLPFDEHWLDIDIPVVVIAQLLEDCWPIPGVKYFPFEFVRDGAAGEM